MCDCVSQATQFILRKDILLSPQSSSLSKQPPTPLLFLFVFPLEKQSISSCLIRVCRGGTFCLLTQNSKSLSDSKKPQLCDCWGKEMLNNWEIKCFKKLYCDRPPPANFISYSALCLPHSQSSVVTNRLGSALHQQQPINYTRLQDQISPKPC